MLSKVRSVKTKKNFNAGSISNAARVYIKSSYSNIFISLTDMSNQVIICCSSGSRV